MVVAKRPATPSSVKDREQGKFRESGIGPRQTVVAVSDDAGARLGYISEAIQVEILTQLQIMNAHLASLTGDVRDETDIPVEA